MLDDSSHDSDYTGILGVHEHETPSKEGFFTKVVEYV